MQIVWGVVLLSANGYLKLTQRPLKGTRLAVSSLSHRIAYGAPKNCLLPWPHPRMVHSFFLLNFQFYFCGNTFFHFHPSCCEALSI